MTSASRLAGSLDRFFGLSERGTSVRTELLAGLTTFVTMAYIMVVNPDFLAKAGMDQGAAFVATCGAATSIPSYATAPALLLVACLMASDIAAFDWKGRWREVPLAVVIVAVLAAIKFAFFG